MLEKEKFINILQELENELVNLVNFYNHPDDIKKYEEFLQFKSKLLKDI